MHVNQNSLHQKETSLEPIVLQESGRQTDAIIQQVMVENDRATTALLAVSSSWKAVRVFALVMVLLLMTLGAVLSVLFLSSNHPTVPIGVLEAHAVFIIQLPPVHFFFLIAIAIFCISVLLFFVGVPLYVVQNLICPTKRDTFIPVTPYALDLPVEEIQFSPISGDHQVSGLFIPHPDASTTIIVCPGYRRSYRHILGMCSHLWKAGHNVLAFEYYGHGKVVGTPITLGYREINDFRGAVAYAKKRGPSMRLGAMGYSMGAAITIIGSAQSQEIEAVVADSAFATHWSAVEVAIHRTLRFSAHLPAWSMRLLSWVIDSLLWLRAGYRMHQVEPVRDIAQIAPRPVLLIHGLNDTIVRHGDARHLYQAAGEPKTLLLFRDTEHVRAYFTDSSGYVDHITAFFDQHLKQERSQLAEQITHSGETEPIVPAGILPATHAHPETPPTRHTSVGSACGHLIYRFRWLVLACWFVVILASLPLAGRVPSILQNKGYSIAGSASDLVNRQVVNKLHRPATQILALFQSKSIPVRDPGYQQEIAQFMSRARAFTDVSDVSMQAIGRDGRSVLVVVGFSQDKDTIAERIPAFRTLLPHSGPARIYLSGDAPVENEIQLDTQADTEFAEMIALPITLLALLIIFGSVVASAMPLVLAGVAISTALATIFLIAQHISVNIFVQSITSIIGLGLSIDYSLLIIRRFREELNGQSSVEAAIAATMATAGEAILFSGLTVMIGFTGLLFIGIDVMSSFGLGGIAIAASSVLGALMLLPALLAVLGTRINALRLPQPFHARLRTSQHTSFWRRWALFMMKRPTPVILLVLVALLVLGWPARMLNPGLPGASALPTGSQARIGLDILHTQFPSVNDNPIDLLVRTPDGSNILSAQNIERLDRLSQWLTTQDHITDVQSLTRIPQTSGALPAIGQLTHLYSSGAYQQNANLMALVHSTTAGDTTLITIRSNTTAGATDDLALIDHLRSLNQEVKQGFITQVGGARVVDLDFNRVLYNNFLRTLAFIFLASFFVLLLTFRSIVLPLKAVIMNVISVSASYGSLVFVFQQGHFQHLLGFSTDGSIDRFIPVLLFCILYGLSMDYEFFLLMRVREEWRKTHDNRAAVMVGLEKTGGTITSAALLFIIVSSSFLLTSLVVTKELGLGISLGIFLDGSIIRCMLVPASMQLFGKWNWWFPHNPFATKAIQGPVPIRARGHVAKQGALIITMVALLGVLVFPFQMPKTRLVVSAPRTATKLVGELAFTSSGLFDVASTQGYNDNLSLNLSHILPPHPGMAYYIWLMPDASAKTMMPDLLGKLPVAVNHTTFSYSSAQHSNLLAAYSGLCITEQPGTSPPAHPSVDPQTWIWQGWIPNVPNPADEDHYSFLAHLRHLLAQDPTLQANGIPGGLALWMTRNVSKVSEWASAAQGQWHGTRTSDADMALIHRHLIRILDYLDGQMYAWHDVPRGSAWLADPSQPGKLGLINRIPNQKPPGYLEHVMLHLDGLAHSVGSTPKQRQLAAEVDVVIRTMTRDLEQIRQQASLLVHMTPAQMHHTNILPQLDELAQMTSTISSGWFDPQTGENVGGVLWISSSLQHIATISINSER